MNPHASTAADPNMGKPWRTLAVKNGAIAKIEEAIMYCVVPVMENAVDIEQRIFQQSETKRDYKKEVERVVDEIYLQAVTSLAEEQGQCYHEERPGPSRGQKTPPPPLTPRQKLRRLQKRQARIAKGRTLKYRALKRIKDMRKEPNLSDLKAGASRKKRLISHFVLQQYLCSLIDQHSNKRRKEAVGDAEMTSEVELFEKEWKAKLSSFFAAIDRQENPLTVPLYLCGSVGPSALFEDPVVVPPMGHTYEREVIEHHLKRRGRYDPITKLTISSDLLIPNQALRELIQDFLQENEWAQRD